MGSPRWLTASAARLALVASLALCTCAPPATAAGGSPLGYAIGAVGFRSYFVFGTHPGRSVHGVLRVTNLGTEARTIELAAVDVSTAAAGGLQYGEGRPRGEGRWLKLAFGSVTLRGGGSTDVGFTVRVPGGARSGDHFLAITAVDRRVMVSRPSGQGIHIHLIPRLAMTIEVRLPGPRTGRLGLGAVSIAVAPSGASLVFRIANLGNTLIASTAGNMTVTQGSTPLFEQQIELAAFVPKTAIALHLPWEGTPVEGTYRVRGELRPAGLSSIPFDRLVRFGSGAIHSYRRLTGRRAQAGSGTPVALVAGLALALLAAVAFAAAYLRARKLLRARS